MSTSFNPSNPISTAVVPYNPSLLYESVIREVARRSLEAKYETLHLLPERNMRVISPSLDAPKSLKTDPFIDIEIFPAITGEKNPPIIIFSHGVGGAGDYRSILKEFANNGYTVLSLTHQSSAKDVEFTLDEAEAVTDMLVTEMVNNIQYVLNGVRKGALKTPGDPIRIFLMGHSLGGAASIMVSRVDQAISGCVNLDGSLKGGAEKTDALPQPLLMLIGDYQKEIRKHEQNPDAEMRRFAKFERRWQEEYEMLCRNSPHSDKQVIPGAIHRDFMDQTFRHYLKGEENATSKKVFDVMKVHSTVCQEVLRFLGFCFSR